MMDTIKNILFEIIGAGGTRETCGLKMYGLPELRVPIDSSVLQNEADTLLHFIVRYLSTSEAAIIPGQTMPYGYWLLKFMEAEKGVIEIYEYQADASEFIRGASLTLRYWREQHDICEQASAEFAPPRPDKMVAISDGVYEGDPVEGVRYPSPEHMSGWWLTTDRYDGNSNNLKVVHFYHVTAKRPDLVCFVALPYGYRFYSQTEEVWYDAKVAAGS